jgi:hypothetical protein
MSFIESIPVSHLNLVGRGIQRNYRYDVPVERRKPFSNIEMDTNEEDGDKRYVAHTQQYMIMAQIQLKDMDGRPIRGRKGGKRVTIPCWVAWDYLPRRIRVALEFHLGNQAARRQGLAGMPNADEQRGIAAAPQGLLEAQQPAEGEPELPVLDYETDSDMDDNYKETEEEAEEHLEDLQKKGERAVNRLEVQKRKKPRQHEVERLLMARRQRAFERYYQARDHYRERFE